MAGPIRLCLPALAPRQYRLASECTARYGRTPRCRPTQNEGCGHLEAAIRSAVAEQGWFQSGPS